MLPGCQPVPMLVQRSVTPADVALTVCVADSAGRVKSEHVFPQRALVGYRNKNNHTKDCVGAFCAVLAPLGWL